MNFAMTHNRTFSASKSFASIGLAALLSLSAGCDSQQEAQELLCNPGDYIFCRCADGAAGTQQCKDDGMSTGECENCQAAGPIGGEKDPNSPMPMPGDTHETTALASFAPCTLPTDCETGVCEFGYCTKACTTVSDCNFPTSECVAHEGKSVCMPKCTAATDCAGYGATSQCGFATASDNWKVTACANWGGQHQLRPVGTDCTPFDHASCNLGYSGRQTVCSPEGQCVTGCFYNTDCLGASTCTAQGTLGQCQ